MTFVLMMAALMSFTASGQQKAELKLNLEKNKQYQLSATSLQTIVQTVNGNQQTIETNSGYTVSMKMLDATPSFLVAEVHIDTMTTTTNTMGKEVTMSSSLAGDIKSQETADIMSYLMNKLSNNTLFAKIDYTGKVVEIVNLKMISDIILKDTAAMTLSGPMASTLKGQIRNMVGESSLANIIESFTRYLPAKTVAIGEEWTISNISHAGGMDLDISTSCKLTGLKDNTAAVTAESSIKAAANAVPMNMNGATITYDNIAGAGKSTLSLDAQTGLVNKGSTHTQITGNLGVSGPGFSMEIPLDITGESTIKRLK